MSFNIYLYKNGKTCKDHRISPCCLLSSTNNNNNKIIGNLIFQTIIPQTKYIIDVLFNNNLSFQALSSV